MKKSWRKTSSPFLEKTFMPHLFGFLGMYWRSTVRPLYGMICSSTAWHWKAVIWRRWFRRIVSSGRILWSRSYCGSSLLVTTYVLSAKCTYLDDSRNRLRDIWLETALTEKSFDQYKARRGKPTIPMRMKMPTGISISLRHVLNEGAHCCVAYAFVWSAISCNISVVKYCLKYQIGSCSFCSQSLNSVSPL